MAKDATDGERFEQWLDEAKIPRTKRSPQQLAVLQAAFVFLQQAGPGGTTRGRHPPHRLAPKQPLLAASRP